MFLPAMMLFSIGLFKKVVFADSIAPDVDRVFNAALSGLVPSSFDAWGGALLYTLQLYFDFSGYSDMAAGLAGLFGVRLPRNFHSPYKSQSIMGFWQRWHMSMTRFFTEFIYLPLALTLTRLVIKRRIRGSAQVVLRLGIPMAMTFLAAGIWHGAGTNFIVFAMMMALAMAVNHAWRKLELQPLPGWLGWGLTMAVVVTGMVLDRAANLDTAVRILGSMVGLSGTVTAGPLLAVPETLVWIGLLGSIVLIMPNTHELLAKTPIVLEESWEAVAPWKQQVVRLHERWRPILTSVTLGISVLSITKAAQFLYYRF
jgi:D-alanyl-lipoteichoic acid acyltransferase DltB (MBOAT superfamily)